MFDETREIKISKEEMNDIYGDIMICGYAGQVINWQREYRLIGEAIKNINLEGTPYPNTKGTWYTDLVVGLFKNKPRAFEYDLNQNTVKLGEQIHDYVFNVILIDEHLGAYWGRLTDDYFDEYVYA